MVAVVHKLSSRLRRKNMIFVGEPKVHELGERSRTVHELMTTTYVLSTIGRVLRRTST